MHPPHQHSRINLAELKAEVVRRLGPERSEQYFGLLNRFLSLKLKKAEFNKICPRIVGRDNIPLHNQIISSILRNAFDAKVPPPVNEVDGIDVIKHVGSKEPLSDLYQQNGLHPAVNQLPNPPSLSNGDILLQSPKKARTGNRDRRVGDRLSALGSNGNANYVPQQSFTTQSVDFNAIFENGESIPSLTKRAVQHHQGLEEQVNNEAEILDESMALCTVSKNGTISVHSTDQSKLLVKKDGDEVSARRSLCPPLGITFCAASPSGALKVLPLASSSKSIISFNIGDLLDAKALKQQMEQIATSQGLEAVPMDCANMLSSGLDAYLKGLVGSSFDLVGARSGLRQASNNLHKHHAYSKLVNGFRPGHHNYQMQSGGRPVEVMHQHRPCCPITVLDFKVAMELNPRQLGEDWPLLLEKICTRAFEEET